MGKLPESDVAAESLRRYFGLHPGTVRAKIKTPHIFSLDEPIGSHVPSSLSDVDTTEEAVAETVESLLKALGQVGPPSKTMSQLDVSPLLDATQSLSAVGEKVQPLDEAADLGFGDAFKLLREIDFAEADSRMFDAGKELGKKGWLVGPLMSPQGLFRALEETDRFMKERYPVEHLIEMTEKPDDFRWQQTILEAIESYRDGRHRVAVLSLFPAIEALARVQVRQPLDVEDVDSITEVNINASGKIKAHGEEEFHLFGAWKASIYGFVDLRWNGGADMLSDDPSELNNINRHWALHGVDDPERWDPIDAHRLLQVAAVLAFEKSFPDTTDKT